MLSPEKQTLIYKKIKEDKYFRKEYLKHFFFRYCQYYFREYFSFWTPPALLKYYKALEEWRNVYFEWFRWCAKTTIAQMFLNYVIAYRLRRNIMWYSQTIDNAEENLTYVANSFIWDTDWGKRFVNDFGNLYYPETINRKGQKKIKRLDKFVTENDCYVRAMSLGTSPRGKNYTAPDWKFRPDLLIFDDVDTIASTQSQKKIDKNFEFMLNEVLWGTTSNTQIIFLWNTIYEDWLVPRFREHIKWDKSREVIFLPIYDDYGKIIRDRFVETDEEAQEKNQFITEGNKKYTSLQSERRRLWSISFEQNYLLKPFVQGMHIITRDMIQRFRWSEDMKFDSIQIWVDPAVSEKQGTDFFAITVVWFKWENRYILECIALQGRDKNIKNACQIVKQLYIKWKASRVVVETVAFQQVLKTIFMNMWMATKEVKTHKDKTTRLMEKQFLFENLKVYFAQNPWCDLLIEELLSFPNVEHDDRVDSMLMALTDKWKKFFISTIW